MRKLVFLLVVLLTLLLVSEVRAHPADMYFHTHTVTLSPEGIQVTWELITGPMVAQAVWYDADQNEDETISDAEAWAWGQKIIPAFGADLDGSALELELQAVEWPAEFAKLFSGEASIRIHLQADWPLNIGQAHVISLHNRFNPKNSLNWFEIHAEDDVTFETPNQNRGALSLRFGRATTGQNTGALTAWKSGSPAFPWVVESLGLDDIVADSATQSQPGTASILEGLLKRRTTSPAFVLAALLVAILLGTLHALSPGHGKTIVAAYLVGSQGKAYHAIALGTLVTLTHTGSVLALGLLTLAASRYLLAADFLPILELLSGLLIFFLGMGLLYPRLRDWRNNHQHQRQMQNRPPLAVRNATGGGKRLVINQPIEESGPPHSHDPSAFVYVPREPSQGNPLAAIRWRSLVTLGISGGLVPCPDAIAILLIAVTINRIAFGMSLIVAFSIGLALILIAIGVLIVQGKRLFERLRWFDRIAYTMPVLSAVVVLAAGAVLTFGAVRNFAGASPGVENATLTTGISLFDQRRVRVIYTALDEQHRYQQFIIPALGGEPQQITKENEGIWDYALAPDYTALIYAIPDGMSGSQLWQWNPVTGERTQLLACPEASCSGIVWFPDGRGILYGRLESDTSAGIVSIWWLDINTLETAPLFQDDQLPGFNPRWSPNGKWLSYTSINPQEIQIYQIETGFNHSLPTQTGSPAIWSPDGESLLLVDIEQVGELYLSKLFRYDLDSQTLSRLSGEEPFSETQPAWSPDGEWIAFIHRERGSDTSTNGDEIWLMRFDGSEAHPVTSDSEAIHGQPVWSPDGRYLLYDMSFADTTGAFSGIYILDLGTGQTQEIATSGNRPTWLP
jgi:ABC-type nickel/cobalt efflux system permease component RcnA/Tol biopolymer transport system component